MMNLLDRLLGHDAWTTRLLLDRCRGLSDEQLDLDFDIGHRTVRATFLHLIGNMETWSDLMAGRPVGARHGGRPPGASVADLIARLDRAAADLAEVARAVAVRGGWDERWVDVLDDPPREKTYGGAIAQVITHSMHHRAHLLYMLRRLGVANLPEGDVLSWENAAAMTRDAAPGTTASRRRRAAGIQDAIRQVLYHDWDPIGVSQLGVSDEYDSYIGGVYRILAGSRSEDELVLYLGTVERDSMGQTHRPTAQLRAVARKLLALDIRLEGPMAATVAKSKSADAVSIDAVYAYLHVRGAARAIEFYKEVFGAAEVLRLAGPDGGVAHAELRFGLALIFLADEFPQHGIRSPLAFGGTGTTIHLHVDDVDALARRAVRAGATMVMEPTDQGHGERQCRIRDPFGHEWLLGHEVKRP